MKNILKWFLNVGLSGAVWYFADKIPWSSIFVGDNWIWLVEERFSWLNAILFIVIFFAVVMVVSYLSKKVLKPKIDPIEKELRKFSAFEDQEKNIRVTWDMYMGSYMDNDPHAYNIQFFCLNHDGAPIRMQYGRCSISGCRNNQANCNEEHVKNIIESQLIDLRNKLKKQYEI